MVAAMRATVFLGAALLFLVQPSTAARCLPAFGGGPVVWTVGLLVFQSLLLAGYLMAARVPTGRWRRTLPFAAACALLLGLAAPAPELLAGVGLPVLRVAAALLMLAGPTYVLLAATAPLLTRAAGADHRLYALSNAGSVVGLLAPPFLLDPFLGHAAQRHLFLGLFAVWAVGVWRALRGAVPDPLEATSRPPAEPRRVRLGRMLGAALGTALLSTTTTALAQDLSVTPLLWILPLLAYLASFIVAFGVRRLPGRAPLAVAAALAVGALVALLHAGWRLSWPVQLGGALGVLFVSCLAVHAELVRRQPASGALGGFYIDLAAGGALGTLAAGLVAPGLLAVPLEQSLAALALWLYLIPPLLTEAAERHPLRPSAPLRGILGAVTLALAAGFGSHAWHRVRDGATWARSVFGALQVKEYGRGDRKIRHLLDGRISHGFQYLQAERRRTPTAYFAPTTGVGRLLSQPGPPRNVAVLGLGVGTLAAYGRAGDRVRFFEINPAAIQVARERFSFLSDAPAVVDVVEGDARVTLAADPTIWDVIVVDAFSGDAIPLHLITEEAVAMYLSRLGSDGVLAVNVSNRHADLPRVLWSHVEHFELSAAGRTATVDSPLGPYRSDWAFLAFDPAALRFAGDVLPGGDAPVRFTDDHAPLLSILR
jgi:hypothetical protein